MNNKLYKKHKPNPKSTNKKKTASRQSKNKSGGAFPSLSGLFSKNKREIETELKPLLPRHSSNSNNIASSASTNSQQPNLNNIESNTSTNTQPNAKPQGFNTIKAQSRCSIL